MHARQMQLMNSPMTDFDDIRPYNDAEVRPTLDRLLADNEFLDAIVRWKMPRLMPLASVIRPFIRRALRKQTNGIETVTDFQARIEDYLAHVVNKTTTRLTTSGLDNLNANEAYCFISNHRDIAMDSAFVNWCLFRHGAQTLRIAIGDNLLTKPFASDLMRLNKSFIVNRSAKGPRAKFKAAKKLSEYIHHSIVEDQSNIWIAQREGRAKDGLDKTNPAIISMLALNRDKSLSLGEYIRELRIVPVTISYEFDPCDESKAKELYTIEQQGVYQKQEHEDITSIARGIAGFKGHVHLAFGEPLHADYASVEEIAADLDWQIVRNYVLHPTNCIAYEMLEQQTPDIAVTAEALPFTATGFKAIRETFQKRVAACDPAWRPMLLRAYANPVYAKLRMRKPTGPN